jgi:hypothetical protein
VKLEGEQLWRFFLQGVFGQQKEESFSPSFPFFLLKKITIPISHLNKAAQ